MSAAKRSVRLGNFKKNMAFGNGEPAHRGLGQRAGGSKDGLRTFPKPVVQTLQKWGHQIVVRGCTDTGIGRQEPDFSELPKRRRNSNTGECQQKPVA